MTLLLSMGKAALGLAALALMSGQTALAEPLAYPAKVVTLVTHSSPGGGSDVFLREMSKYLGKYINATFIVENVQGAAGQRRWPVWRQPSPMAAFFTRPRRPISTRR